MAHETQAGTSADAEYVQFRPAGEWVKGEFHCAECGYGVTVYRQLPVCPMCGGESWEQSPWSPFGLGRSELLH
jgi:rubrerythrin